MDNADKCAQWTCGHILTVRGGPAIRCPRCKKITTSRPNIYSGWCMNCKEFTSLPHGIDIALDPPYHRGSQ